MTTTLSSGGHSSITTLAELNDVISQADGLATNSGAYEIDLGGDIALTGALDAINLKSGVSLDIVGNHHTIDGQSSQRGLFVYSGTVTISDLTIQHMKAVGGDGAGAGGGGGGGAGLGGGLFVADNSTADGGTDANAVASQVTLNNVSFANNAAVGGAGGVLSVGYGGGGGGGLGGGGGQRGGLGTGGGGGGISGVGGAGAHGNGGAGIVVGGGGGGSGSFFSPGAGGANGGGGGASGSSGGGGGGGVGGSDANSSSGGGGGFGGGGGGGGGFGAGAGGGFGGGGGGGGYSHGGGGGFGGGGGGGDYFGGAGGVGAGAGSTTAGGGGLGAGGDVFVQHGASLIITGGTSLAAGTVTGGTGATAGSAFGNSLFIQGDTSITLGTGQATSQTTTISGDIADQTGNGGTGGQAGAGILIVAGAGTVVLSAINTYTGATTVNAGTLLIDGSIAGSATTVNSGATLGGYGTTGAVSVASGGTLAPGNSPGQLTVNGDLSLSAGANYAEQLGGTTVGTGYDQTVVSGNVDLTGSTLDLQLYGGFTPAAGNTFTIINKTSSGAVTGTFSGLAEGATVSVGGTNLTLSYVGGDGNDVTLSVLTPPSPGGGGGGGGSGGASVSLLPSILQGGVTVTTQAGVPVQPFASMRLTNPNSGGTDSITIALNGGGTLADGQGFGGLTRNPDGSYSLVSGSAAQLTAELRALVFTPGDAPHGSTTGFTFTDHNSAGQTTVAMASVVTEAPPPTFTFDQTVSFLSSTHAVLSGTVADPSNISGIEVFTHTAAGTVDLGAATVLSDGTWTIDDDQGRSVQGSLYAVATDGSGLTTRADADYGLTTGIRARERPPGQPYTATQSIVDQNGDVTNIDYFRHDGSMLFEGSKNEQSDGSSSWTYSDGAFFDNKAYVSFIDLYGSDGQIQARIEDNSDGTHLIQGIAGGLTLNSEHDDAFRLSGTSNTLAFSGGFGHAIVTNFILGGAGHDMIELPASSNGSSDGNAERRLAAMLNHVTVDAAGDAVLHANRHDSITFEGITAAQLRRHAGDIAFGS